MSKQFDTLDIRFLGLPSTSSFAAAFVCQPCPLKRSGHILVLTFVRSDFGEQTRELEKKSIPHLSIQDKLVHLMFYIRFSGLGII